MQDAISPPQFIGRKESVITDRRSDESQRYQIVQKIGEGGYGAVYEARDSFRYDYRVAIKSINLSGLTTTQIIEATDGFNREVKLLSNLNHPHLPHIYDHFTDPEHWYLIMEYIAGETLEDYLENRQHALPAASLPGLNLGGILPLTEIFEISLQLCDVLQYLHTCQPPIIFRDLKPANIMRTSSGYLYLIDFGIARHFKPGQQKDTIPLGSPGYAAPEQYGKAQTDPRADIYSLGALLHHLLTGNNPSDNVFSFAPLPPMPPELAGLDRLIADMLALNPQHRPDSINHIMHTLTSYQRNYLAPGTTFTAPVTPYQSSTSQQSIPSSGGQQQMMGQIMSQTTAKKRRIGRRNILGMAVAGTTSAIVLGSSTIPWKKWFEPASPDAATMPQSETASIYPRAITMDTLKFELNQGGLPGINIVDWSYNAELLAVAEENSKRILLQNIENGKIAEERQVLHVDETHLISTFSWRHRGNSLVCGTTDGTIYIWPWLYADHQPAPTIIHVHTQAVTALDTIIPLGGANSSVVCASLDGMICLLDEQSKSLRYTYYGHKGNAVFSIAVSSNNKYVASGDISGILRIWLADSYQTTFIYKDNGAILSLAWSPDDTMLIVANRDGDITCWQTDTYQQLWHTNLQNPDKYERISVSWSPDGQHFAASSSNSYLIYIYDKNGKKVLTYHEHNARVTIVNWSTLGIDERRTWLVSGDSNAEVHTWQFLQRADDAQ